MDSQVIKIGCTFKDVQGTPMLMYSVHYVCMYVHMYRPNKINAVFPITCQKKKVGSVGRFFFFKFYMHTLCMHTCLVHMYTVHDVQNVHCMHHFMYSYTQQCYWGWFSSLSRGTMIYLGELGAQTSVGGGGGLCTVYTSIIA